MAKIFYAQRLLAETIAEIKRQAGILHMSESEIIAGWARGQTFEKAPEVLNTPSDRKPILKPSAKKL